MTTNDADAERIDDTDAERIDDTDAERIDDTDAERIDDTDAERRVESDAERLDETVVDGAVDADSTVANGEFGGAGSRNGTGPGQGPAAELVGTDLAVGYPGTDDPVVECGRVLLPPGEVTAFVGPNGSGKSTLLKALAGQLEPWAGTVALDGDDVYAMDRKALARRVGLLPQQRSAPESLTVEELVTHGRYPHRGFFEALSADDRAAVDRAIDRVDVDDLRDAELGRLSGGQRQLAGVAMTLAQEPDVLLLDEPTTFLDLHHQLRVLDVVRDLNRAGGVTVGVVLHDVAQAARYADNVVALRDGETVDWGPPREVVTEELLADVFDVEATVGIGPEGPTVTPLRPLDD